MNEVDAVMRMLDGEDVARCEGKIRRRIVGGRIVKVNNIDGSDGPPMDLDAADDWEIVPREPTLLELAKKIWPEAKAAWATDEAYAHVSCNAGHVAYVHAGNKGWSERRLRIALEAIIKAENL